MGDTRMPFRLLSKPLPTICFSWTRLAEETGPRSGLSSALEGLTVSPPPPDSQDSPSSQGKVALTAPQCGSAEREVRSYDALTGPGRPVNYKNADLLSYSQGVGLLSGQGRFPCTPAQPSGSGAGSCIPCLQDPQPPGWHRTTEPGTASKELCSGSHLFVTKLRLKSKFQKLQPPHPGKACLIGRLGD